MSKPKIVHYGRWRTQFFLAFVALTLAGLVWFGGNSEFSRWVGLALIGPFGLFCLLVRETRFESAKRLVERRWMLLGLLTIRRRQWPLAEFRQICWQSVGSWEEGAGCAWKVGLERSSGQRLFLSFFDARPNCRSAEAKQFALELSKLTGLPLSDEIAEG